MFEIQEKCSFAFVTILSICLYFNIENKLVQSPNKCINKIPQKSYNCTRNSVNQIIK